MKVNGPGSSGPIGQASNRARPSSGGFSLDSAEQAGASAPAASVSDAAPVSSLDALIALQEYPTSLDRRRRAVKRASTILDKLDQIKLALLGGDPEGGVLASLASAVREARDDTADPGLESVLNEIETRAAVELAKREARNSGV
jgi:L-fucose isomerase-like protein